MQRFGQICAIVAANVFLTPIILGQWIPVESSGTDAGLRGIHDAGNGVIWASGTKGTILRSVDDGFVWQKCAIPPDAEKLDFRAVWAWDASHAMAMSIGPGDASRLYETTDSGASWRLIFKNPDPTGFWDGLAFSGKEGMLVGDPVDGRFTVFTSSDSGQHWKRNTSPQLKAEPAKNGIFAASNSSLAIRATGSFGFATGGMAGPQFLTLSNIGWSSAKLPLSTGTESSGAFSVAFRTPDVGIVVGGDYKKPDESAGTAAYTNDSGVHWTASAKPPSGFRSAVAWSSKLQCWIAVGSNGSDVSFDDGKTWIPFGSGNWNALSLPWVVGPKGQIARLDEKALEALAKKPQSATDLKVTPAWTHHTGAIAPNKRAASIAAFEATPTLVDGLLYVITPFNQVLALDPATGEERWHFDPEIAKDRFYSEATARGVTVSQGMLLFGTLDARLIALRANNGERVWESPIAPEVKDGNFQITSPPVVVRQTAIVGSSIGDNGRAQMERGVVRAFDLQTGKPKWAWDPTPSGKTGAANAWSRLAADDARDMVFVPTGSASPDFYGGLRPGDDRYANSVVALRASTGEFLWSFQVVHHDLWDYDVASAPVLVNWKGKPAVAVLTKVGHYFVLDRQTGKPLLPVEERPFPKSDVSGEMASETQPVPASGLFTAQKFVPRPGWCEEQFRSLRYEGVFTPPSLKGTLVFPGNVGGANWGGASYDPDQNLLFVAANRLATQVRLIPRETFDKSGHGDTGERLGVEYGAQSGAPFAMSRRTFIAPDGRPCNQEPWGALAAIEVNTGKLQWEAPMTVSLGGPLFVKNAVFFGGGLFENKFRAYAARDGKLLFEANLPFSANSTPGTYEWQGKRYVVICAGGHGKVDGNKLGDLIMAFTVE